MCRNIKTLFNFDPPATDEEIRASAIQFVRKVSGTRQPSKENKIVFDLAIDKIEAVTRELIDSLVTSSPPRNRALEATKASLRTAKRFGNI